MERTSKLKLPQLEIVTLDRFSLYTANPSASFECGEGVLCLVGANGIGKSTLLSAINFGLTGIVSEPARRFDSIDEYYQYSIRYSESYFNGRISERDREEASIKLKFTVGDFSYEIRRGMFSPVELRSLTIKNKKTGATVVSTQGKSRSELHELYASTIADHIGLSSFQQFVFLQHFVFTFDERRRTLFWDQKILELVLYLTFGVNPDDAKKVDSMKREIESADSLVRNNNWQATEIRKKINETLRNFKSSSVTQESFEALSEKHEKLSKRLDDERERLNTTEKELKDANLRLADRSSKESALRDQYTEIFNRRLKKSPHIAHHPLLTVAIADHRCGLCGAHGASVASEAKRKLEATNCPICETVLKNEKGNGDAGELRKIDEALAVAKEGIKDSLKELERLRKTEAVAVERVTVLETEVADFESKNLATLSTLKKALTEKGGIDAVVNAYRIQLQDLLDKKEQSLKTRNRLKAELLVIQREIQKEYASAEKVFVPAFSELANLFLGMDLEVQMNASDASGLNLVVEVKGTTRRQPHNLSESQRFFLDIALRMAITQFISHSSSKGSLFIDTPEGSLDIAYEKRAGDMLSKFASKGHRIVMTANLNSSKLLLALASNCKRKGMTLCRMTEWGELSEVQVQEGQLFEDAFAEIEKTMGS